MITAAIICLIVVALTSLWAFVVTPDKLASY